MRGQEKVFSRLQQIEQQIFVFGEGERHEFIDDDVISDLKDLASSVVESVHCPLAEGAGGAEIVVVHHAAQKANREVHGEGLYHGRRNMIAISQARQLFKIYLILSYFIRNLPD